MRELLRFPNPVNEVAARVVASGVVLLCLTILVTRQTWLIGVLAYGFVARVLSGPRFSPLGLLATKVIVPRAGLAPKPVPGPPKRFAQGIGAVLSVGALLAVVFGAAGLAFALVAMVAAAAFLEAAFAFCLGCKVFAGLIRVGVVPASVCAECADISAHLAAAPGSR